MRPSGPHRGRLGDWSGKCPQQAGGPTRRIAEYYHCETTGPSARRGKPQTSVGARRLIGSGLLEELAHEVRRVAAVTARRADRGDAALRRPVRHRPLGDLEEQGDLPGAQQAAVQRLGYGVRAVQPRTKCSRSVSDVKSHSFKSGGPLNTSVPGPAARGKPDEAQILEVRRTGSEPSGKSEAVLQCPDEGMGPDAPSTLAGR